MSRNQKAPLLAFVLVAIICALVLVDTIRGEASERPIHSATTSELAPAQPLAVEPEPIAPAASSPSDVAPRTPGSPDRIDARPADPRKTASPGAIGRSADFPSAGSGEAAAVLRRAPQGQRSYDDELWPPSSVPGVRKPIVAFTMFLPAGDGSSADATEEPDQGATEEPTTEADPDGSVVEPQEPDGSDAGDPAVPGDGPDELQPADPGTTP